MKAMKTLSQAALLVSFLLAGNVYAAKHPEACKIQDEGYVGKEWKEIVILKEDHAIGGANTSREAIGVLKELVKNGVCQNFDQSCQLQGEGSVSGVWMKQRVVLGETPVFGANDLDTLMENVRELRQMGLCQD